MSYLVHLLIDPPLSESQAGIKVMRRDVLDAVLPHLQCDGFAIDVELMAWSKRLGFRRHAVQPVSFQHDGNSTVTLRRSMAVVGELVRLRMRFASSDVRRTTYRRGVRAERHVHELAAHAHRLAAIDTPIADAAAELAERAGSQRRIDAARDIVRTQRSRRNDGSREHIDQLLAAARATLPTSRWHTLVDSFTGPERVHGPRPAGQVR